MRRVDENAYYQHFLRADQSITLMFSLISTIFITILWGKYLFLPMWTTFQTPLLKTVSENGEEWLEISGSGWLLGLWSLVIGITFIVSLAVSIYKLLILRDVKREQNLTYLETFIGWRSFDAEDFDGLSLALVTWVTSLLVPVLSLLPIEVSNGTKIFAIYLLTFLLWSTYGLRNDFLNKQWAQALEKEKEKEKKEKQKQAKEAVEKKRNDEKTKDAAVRPSIQQLLLEFQQQTHYYELVAPFQEEVVKILNEIRLFDVYSEHTSIEDGHQVERMLQEEIPAVLTTYQELDEEGKNEYYPALKECLEKMHQQLESRTKEKQDIKKLGAQKVIEILQKRY